MNLASKSVYMWIRFCGAGSCVRRPCSDNYLEGRFALVMDHNWKLHFPVALAAVVTRAAASHDLPHDMRNPLFPEKEERDRIFGLPSKAPQNGRCTQGCWFVVQWKDEC